MVHLRYLLSAFLTVTSLYAFSQTDLTTQLVNKEWVIKTYEINGKYHRAKDVDKEGYVLFGADSVKSVKKGIEENCKWKYDASRKYLVLYADDAHKKSEMKILLITEKQLVWETTNPKGETIKVFMFAKE